MNEPFHIWYERSGGFAGMTVSMEIASDSLTEDVIEDINLLIDSSGFFEHHQISNDTGVPDQFHYKITIEKNGSKMTREFGESTMPNQFRSLVDYLSKMARKNKR